MSGEKKQPAEFDYRKLNVPVYLKEKELSYDELQRGLPEEEGCLMADPQYSEEDETIIRVELNYVKNPGENGKE